MNYRKITLNEAIQFKNGKKRPSSEGQIPVYGGNGILGYSGDSNFGPCIIIGRVGAYCGSVYLEEDKCWVSDNAIAALPSGDNNIRFFYYLFKWLNLNERHIGTSQPLLTQEILNKINCDVPYPQDQQRIAALLGSLDNKIAANQRINDHLEQQAITICREWFLTNPESKGWPLVTLDSLTSLVSRGIAPKYSDNSEQIVLNQKCIREHYIDVSVGRLHVPKVINDKWLKYGDLLINSTGEGTLGRSAQVWFVPQNMTVDSHITIVRAKSQLLLFYIGFWGISHEREIESLHTGSTGQTELPRDRVKAMELYLPDNDTLTRFNDVIAPLVSTIVVNHRENAHLASIRDTLLPKLMSGEIDVSAVQL